MNGVEILLIIGLGIAVSAIAHRRGVEPGLIIVVLAGLIIVGAGRRRQIVASAAAKPAADLDASFETQRLALGRAVADRELDEEVARAMIEDIDLRQAARNTAT